MSTLTVKFWESGSTTSAGNSATNTATSSNPDKHKAKRRTSTPSDVLEKDGINRYLNSLSFDDPYHTAARLGDSHEMRLKEHVRRIEQAFS
ncbi:hypothetical protein PHISP_06705 [Aspergillus sp. HF37]|nr:hypothetical protein PHISP_06705 [Aspergillus sp. HF37]